MNEKEVDFAIYLPTYNRPLSLPKVLGSIFRQSEQNFKVYILDRSQGVQRKIVRENLEKLLKINKKVKVFYDDDFVPLGEAYNKLLFEYSDKDEKYSILYVDDTFMIRHKLKCFKLFLDSNPNTYLTCSRLGLITHYEEDEEGGFIDYETTEIGNFEVAESGWMVADLCSTCIRRKVIDNVGKIKIVQQNEGVDCNYWKQITMSGFYPIYGSQAIAKFINFSRKVCMDLAFQKTRDNASLREQITKGEIDKPYE
jgi:uncharacterized protein (UPF0248 family)